MGIMHFTAVIFLPKWYSPLGYEKLDTNGMTNTKLCYSVLQCTDGLSLPVFPLYTVKHTVHPTHPIPYTSFCCVSG